MACPYSDWSNIDLNTMFGVHTPEGRYFTILSRNPVFPSKPSCIILGGLTMLQEPQ